MPLKGIACRVSRHRPAASSGLQSGARQMCRRSSHMRNCCRCLQDAAEELAAALSPDFRDRFLLLASFALKEPALAGAADTSQISPSGYKPWPSADWQQIAVRHLYEPCADPMLRHLCAVRGNPWFLVCDISVPLNGATISRRWMSTHEDVGNWADSPWKERRAHGNVQALIEFSSSLAHSM